MKIAIIGYGFVGKAMYNYFKNHYKTIWYDPFIEGSCSKEDVNTCDMSVVCVYTPIGENGECDITIVHEVISWITTRLILLKSTVGIGTTKLLKEKYNKKIVFSPEYIGESTYDTGYYNFNSEVKNHGFFIFGGDKNDTSEMVSIFQVISGPTKIYKQVDENTAEIAKYMTNNYLSTKLIFCHEFNQICKKYDIDYNEARECWLLDPRIGKSHTVIFKDKDYPFDGKCFPKDLIAMIQCAKKAGYSASFLQEVWNSNERLKDIPK